MFFSNGLFGLLFTSIFLFAAGMIVVNVLRGLSEWNSNNKSPRLTTEASIVSKRTDVTRRARSNVGNTGGYHTTSSTMYYVTFQVPSGDRMELLLNGRDYGMLAEGDYGRLTFQGTRYLSFERFI